MILLCNHAADLRAFTIWSSELKINAPQKLIICKNQNLEAVTNLNSYSLKKFDKPPVKNKGARFRRHPIKEGNLTVTLSNYDIEKNSKAIGNWMTSIQYGTGKGFPIQHIEDGYYKKIESIISKFKTGKKFIDIIKKTVN